MDPGNLVTITRASVGVPLGTVGLITEVIVNPHPTQFTTYVVKAFIDGTVRGRRYLARDLEKIQ